MDKKKVLLEKVETFLEKNSDLTEHPGCNTKLRYQSFFS